MSIVEEVDKVRRYHYLKFHTRIVSTLLNEGESMSQRHLTIQEPIGMDSRSNENDDRRQFFNSRTSLSVHFLYFFFLADQGLSRTSAGENLEKLRQKSKQNLGNFLKKILCFFNCEPSLISASSSSPI